MTKNEYLEIHWSIEDTIENLKTIKEHFIATVLKTNLDGKGKQDAKEVEFDFNRAIQALEEIQQYRTIGTVEELKSMKENGAFTGVELAQLAAMQMRLKEYSAIGTIEEFKALKEKNEPKEMDRFYCPICRHYFEDTDAYNYCPACGQKMKPIWQ